MHIINFLIALFLPYISLFSKLAPPETIPAYFFSDEAAFVAGEFGAVVFYWAGFLRNFVARGVITERDYFTYAGMTLIFMCASKIIFTLPYTWITDIFAFGLGVLSLSDGQTLGKYSVWLLILLSIVVLICSSSILIGMAWFDFHATAYYQYKDLLEIYIYDIWHRIKSLF